MTSRMILRRNDINVFHIFAAALRAFEITKLNLFAQGDGRYVLSAVFKVMYRKDFIPGLYISLMGYFFKLFAGNQETTPNNTAEDLLFLIIIQEVMGSNLDPEYESRLSRFTILTHQFHTDTRMSPQIRG